MRNYGDTLTQEHLDGAETRAVQRSTEIVAQVVSTVANDIDAKQAKQINQLRLFLAASFVANAALTLVLYFVK